MHRIDTPTAQKDKFGAGKNGFTAGNPQTGIPATDLDNDYFDMLQEELAGIVEATGVNLDKSKHNQLLTALKALLLSRAHPFADIKADGPAAIAEALSNLGLGAAAKSGVVQTTGQSEKDVISQKGATDSFALKSLFDHFGGATLMFSGGRDYSLQLSDTGVLSLYSLALNKMVMSWSSSGELVAGTIGFEHVKELKSAAKKDVGNSAGQIPDMSYFELSGIGTDNMIAKLPNGLIIQVFRRNISNSASVGVATINPVTFPTPFPGAVWGVFCTKMTYAQINTSCESVTNSGFSATTCAVSGVASTTSSSAVFLAIGYA